MRFDRKVVELRDLIGGTVVATDYMELTIEKDGKRYRVFLDIEYGYYEGEETIAEEITEIKAK